MKKNYLLFTLTVMLIGTSANAQYTTLLNFDGATNGMNPNGSLISDGTFLYGMTKTGGTNDLGTIFKILPDGTGYSNLLNFAGVSNGSYPDGSLISDGIFLYGVTASGGTNNIGTIFKIKTDGTGYVKLLDFSGISNGSISNGSLIFDGTFLYGMTGYGGINDMGTIFKIKTDGTSYVKLLDFAGATNGSEPWGSLISDGIFLYGMTSMGGTNNMGTIFKIMPDGTGFVKLLDFAGATTGSQPWGSLISDGTFLYGMTYIGGANNMGTIFKIKTNGSSYSKLLDFAGTTNGRWTLRGSLISDGNFLYGITSRGGTNDKGTIFKIMPDGTGYSNLLNFAGTSNGSSPQGTLFSDGSFLYGMTKYGGTSDKGVVFKFGLTTGLDETNSESELTIYPNPTTGIINISMHKANEINGELPIDIGMISITNILGEVVLNKEINLVTSTSFSIDISNQPAGIYFLKIGNSVEKIIRQ